MKDKKYSKRIKHKTKKRRNTQKRLKTKRISRKTKTKRIIKKNVKKTRRNYKVKTKGGMGSLRNLGKGIKATWSKWRKKNPYCHWNKSLRCPPGQSRKINRVLPFKCCVLEKWKMFDDHFMNLVKAGKTPEQAMEIAVELTTIIVKNKILKEADEVIEKYKSFSRKSDEELQEEKAIVEKGNLIKLLEEHLASVRNLYNEIRKFMTLYPKNKGLEGFFTEVGEKKNKLVKAVFLLGYSQYNFTNKSDEFTSP